MFKKPFGSKKKDTSPDRKDENPHHSVNYDSGIENSQSLNIKVNDRYDSSKKDEGFSIAMNKKNDDKVSLPDFMNDGLSINNNKFGIGTGGGGELRLSEEFKPKKSTLNINNSAQQGGGASDISSRLVSENITFDDSTHMGGGVSTKPGGRKRNQDSGAVDNIKQTTTIDSNKTTEIKDPFAKFDNFEASGKDIKLPDNFGKENKKEPRKHVEQKPIDDMNMGFGLFNPVDDNKRVAIPSSNQQSTNNQAAGANKKLTLGGADPNEEVFDKVQIRKGPRDRKIGSTITEANPKKSDNDLLGDNELKLSSNLAADKKEDKKVE